MLLSSVDCFKMIIRRIQTVFFEDRLASGNPYPFASFTHLSYTRDMTWIFLSGKSYDVIYQGYDMDIPNANN